MPSAGNDHIHIQNRLRIMTLVLDEEPEKHRTELPHGPVTLPAVSTSTPQTKKPTKKRKRGHSWVRPKPKKLKNGATPASQPTRTSLPIPEEAAELYNSNGYATINDLPNEVIIIILENLRLLDYRKYRVLRLHPRLTALMDARFVVMQHEGAVNPVYAGTPGCTFGKFSSHKEFLDLVTDMLQLHRIRERQVTIYADMSVSIHSNHAQHLDALAFKISKWAFHSGLAVSIVAPRMKAIQHGSSAFDKRKRGIVEFVDILRPGDETVVDMTKMGREKATRRTYEALPRMNLISKHYGDIETMFKDMYWKHTLERLESLVCIFEQPHTIVKALCNLSELKALKTLDLRAKTESNKERILQLNNLDFPFLTHLNVWSASTKSIVGNTLPSLEQLHIEDVDMRSNGYHALFNMSAPALTFKDNYMPKLSSLSLSTDTLRQFSFKDKIPALERFRLELRDFQIQGNNIHLLETIEHTKHLSLMTKSKGFDVSILERYVELLLNTQNLESLSLNCNEARPGSWLTKLQNKRFLFLRTLRLYNLVVNELKPFDTPRLQTLIFMGTESPPRTIHIRAYPLIKQIITHVGSRDSTSLHNFEHSGYRLATFGTPVAGRCFSITPEVRIGARSDYPTWARWGSVDGSPSFCVYDAEEALRHGGLVRLDTHERGKKTFPVLQTQPYYMDTGAQFGDDVGSDRSDYWR